MWRQARALEREGVVPCAGQVFAIHPLLTWGHGRGQCSYSAARCTELTSRRDIQIAFILSYPAARAFVEMRKSSSPFLHLVHPRPVKSKAIMEPIASELGVPLVPYPEWLSKLEECARDGSADEVDGMRANPALRLLDFFRAQHDGGSSNPRPRSSTAKAEKASQELARMRELSEEDAKRWVATWHVSGFLSTYP